MMPACCSTVLERPWNDYLLIYAAIGIIIRHLIGLCKLMPGDRPFL